MNFKNAKVFITGGTGLLGSHLTKALVDQGAEVIALVRDGVPRSLFYSKAPGWELDQKVVTIRGEIENYALMERILNEYEIDTVFHLAAQTLVGTANTSPIATFRANIEGTWNVLEAARVHQKRVKRIVIASSDKAYGNLSGNAYDESFPLHGDHPYDVSKSCADLISQSYFKTYSLPVSITRCGNFFGPGDLNFSRIIPGTVMSVMRGEAPIIRSDGKFIRDYIYAEDGAHAYMTLAHAMTANAMTANSGSAGHGSGQMKNGHAAFAGEAFNFSYGLRLSVLDVVNAVLKIMKREDLKPVIQNQAQHEIPVQTLDSAKAKRELNWKPKLGFEEGLRTTVEWYKDYFTQKSV